MISATQECVAMIALAVVVVLDLDPSQKLHSSLFPASLLFIIHLPRPC